MITLLSSTKLDHGKENIRIKLTAMPATPINLTNLLRLLLLLPTTTTSLLRSQFYHKAAINKMTVTRQSMTSTKSDNAASVLPTMIVFDLDDCLWSPEMYTLHDKPSIPQYGDLGDGQRGVIGLQVPPAGPTVRLFPGARQVLRKIATDSEYKNVILASASSSEEPTYSYACLDAIEVLPGLTMRQMFKYNQIGRTGRLTPDKKTHFKLLHEESRVPYNEMLFFDDCNWGDHCTRVSQAYGVVSQATPSGLHYSEFQAALEKFRLHALSRTK